jgi:2-polyprenyl-3-methyl-5-hydroxy-6-metoxy-1,4-benzoquinol methylase
VVALTGADVDADNAQWCASHLPFGSFHAIPLHPPTAFADASFDVVIGVSVFTHLTESVQFEWLHELRRLVRRDGCVLVSVHARAAAAQQAAWPLRVLSAWEQRGFVDGKSPDLDGYLEEADYYRTTLHHPDYIRREWTKVFPALEIIEGYLGNQALCVLKP